MIRLSGEFGGIVLVVLIGLIFAGLITWMLDLIQKFILKGNGKKIFWVLHLITWSGMIILLVLDILDVFPLIRYILFSVLD